MDELIRLGPVSLSLERLWIVEALAIYLLATEVFVRRTHDHRLRDVAWNAVIWGLVGARLGYILPRWEVYGLEPLSILYVWQGGFTPLWGMVVGGGYALVNLGNRPSLRYLLIAAGLGLLVLGLVYRPANSADLRLPTLSLSTMQGENFDLASLAGEPLVVNAWATWCPPCRKELPMMAEEAEAHPGVKFAFVSQGEGAEIVRAYLSDAKLSLPLVLLDLDLRMSEVLKVQGLPTTLFFSADGKLMASHAGELSRPQLRDYLTQIMQ